jgi:hypothetical protein
MPCLSHVALVLLADKNSSGRLECDIGGISDIIAKAIFPASRFD